MNRYVVLRSVYDSDDSGDAANYVVADLTNDYVIADCGDSVGRANKVAGALNDLDGGPL